MICAKQGVLYGLTRAVNPMAPGKLSGGMMLEKQCDNDLDSLDSKVARQIGSNWREDYNTDITEMTVGFLIIKFRPPQ